MAAQDIPTDRPAVKDRDFRFTETGFYRTRGNDVAYVMPGHSLLHGWISVPPNTQSWYKDGRFSCTAGHLNDLVAGPFDTFAEAAQPEFRITAPGLYRNRAGQPIKITHKDNSAFYFKWRAGDGFGYKDDGSYWSERQVGCPEDIVAGPFPEEAKPQADAKELAGLSGYGVFTAGYCTHLAQYEDAARKAARKGELVIDLSTITKDQLVTPEPEAKRVRQWLNVYRNNSSSIWDSREEADRIATPNRIACIEVEFVEGQGLGDVT